MMAPSWWYVTLAILLVGTLDLIVSVIRSETTLHRNKFHALPVIRPVPELPEMDGDIALLHQMRDQILSTPIPYYWQMIDLWALEQQQDMWTDWFHEAPWPEDHVGQQIADWKAQLNDK